MKTHKIHTDSELKIFSKSGSTKNEVNGNITEESIVTVFYVDDSTLVNIQMYDNEMDDKLLVNLQYSIEQIEHLHSWLGLLLKSKTTTKKTKKTKKV